MEMGLPGRPDCVGRTPAWSDGEFARRRYAAGMCGMGPGRGRASSPGYHRPGLAAAPRGGSGTKPLVRATYSA